MRQVNRDELIYVIQSGIRSITPALRREWTCGVPEKEARARVLIAGIVADKLGRFEVLTQGPLPMTMGESAFSVPLEKMLGEDR